MLFDRLAHERVVEEEREESGGEHRAAESDQRATVEPERHEPRARPPAAQPHEHPVRARSIPAALSLEKGEYSKTIRMPVRAKLAISSNKE